MSDKLTNKTEREGKTPSRSAVAMLISLIVLSVLLFGTYRLMMNYYYFEIVMMVYMAIETVFVAVYVIYNRGFSRRGVTADMLPSDWSCEKKESFIADAQRRVKRSRWMLIVILAFLFTFMVDIIELWIIPTVTGWFGV